MKFETIKNKKYFLYVLITGVVLLITIILSTSLAKYKVTQSIKIASGNITYSPSDLNIMSIYLKNEGSSTYTNTDLIPESGYELNSEESYCEVNGSNINVTITYDMSTKEIQLTPFTTKGTKCYLYFDEEVIIPAAEQIIALAGNGQVFNEGNAGYRYEGKTVDNYVEFNNETWRIISVENGSQIGLTSGEYYIKLIRESSIGLLAWGSSSSGNVWSSSSLYSTLNNAYLNRTSSYSSTGLNSTARSQIVKVNWYTNGISSSSDTHLAIYNNERSVLSNYVNNFVGLPYPSDYGYASPRSLCSNYLSDYGVSCYASNWLFMSGSDFWTITYNKSAYGTAETFLVNSNGGVSSNNVRTSHQVRPTIYLRSDISFVKGTTGSSSNMFKIRT